MFGHTSPCAEYLAHGSPPTWWFLGCVPFSSASGFTLVRLLAQSGTCTGPGRRTQRPAKIRTSPTRLLIIQRRTASCTSGSWVSRPTGVADGLSGPSAPELVAPEPEAGGMVGCLSGPSAPGRATPEPPAFGMGRHWKPGKIKTQLPTSQRALEQHLRARWLERLLGYFIPFRHQIPYMHQVMGARELEEFGHLFGDARFRTI